MVNAFPSLVRQLGLDLANQNILKTSVTSAGIKIPLPIDSCLVSKKRADVVSQNCPDLNQVHQTGNTFIDFCCLLVLSRSLRHHADSYRVGKWGGGGGAGAKTPSVPLSFCKQLLPLPKPLLLSSRPHSSPRPPIKILVVDKTLLGRCLV